MSHGLWSDKQATKHAEETGDITLRRVGRSTRIAFELFAECYLRRGEWVKIRDHYGTREADRYLMDSMYQMAEKLGYQFDWNLKTLSLRLRE